MRLSLVLLSLACILPFAAPAADAAPRAHAHTQVRTAKRRPNKIKRYKVKRRRTA